MYFLDIANEELIGIDCLGYQKGGISYPISKVEVTEEVYNDYLENPDKYMWDGESVVENPEYEAKQAQAERERLDALSVTRGDMFEALILAKQKTKADLRTIIENFEGLSDIERALYLNRFDEALDFFRGHPAVNLIGQALDITPEQLDNYFVTKDWQELIKAKTPEIQIPDELDKGFGVESEEEITQDDNVNNSEETENENEELQSDTEEDIVNNSEDDVNNSTDEENSVIEEDNGAGEGYDDELTSNPPADDIEELDCHVAVTPRNDRTEQTTEENEELTNAEDDRLGL